MKLHSPMNMMLMLFAAAFGTCHAQLASILLILFTYSVTVASLETQEPGSAIAATLAFAWLTGCAAGLVFLALKIVDSQHDCDPQQGLSPLDQGLVWQDVRGQCAGRHDVDPVRMEPSVSHLSISATALCFVTFPP